MSGTDASAGGVLRRTLTHPLTPGLVIAAGALGAAAWFLAARPPVLVAWVVLALAAGYSISGSV